MKKLEADVLVIGAGPAGSSAARTAALGGARTIFVDRKDKIGSPVQCAEGIGEYLFQYLPVSIPKSQLNWKIDGIVFQVEEISIEKKGGFWMGYTVDREKFDIWLADEAIKTGAELWTNAKLIDLEYDEENNVNKAIIKKDRITVEVEPKVLVAADGVESTVLKLMELYKPKREDISEVYSWKMKNLHLNKPHFEQIYVGDFTPSGYAYIFPKSKTEANIGVGGIFPKKDVEDYFHEFLDLAPLRKQVKNAEFVEERSKKAVVGDITDKWVYGNVLLAGDVANHTIKPFIEGILPAIITGNLAGELSSKICLGDVISSEYYMKSVERLLHPHFQISKELGQILTEWFKTKGKEKHLMITALVAGLFELERLEELEAMNYESLKTMLLDIK